ncbi:MAG: hypothetical protein N4A62_14190 [Marinisporobacter sp.]|nr:hypothetical protein [Marinisporobacter sp.]
MERLSRANFFICRKGSSFKTFDKGCNRALFGQFHIFMNGKYFLDAFENVLLKARRAEELL